MEDRSRCCKCEAPCVENFKKVVELKQSGLTIYVYARRDKQDMEKPKSDVISYIVEHLNKKTFPVEVLVDTCIEKFSAEDIIYTRNIVTDAFEERIDLTKPRTTETKNIRQDIYKLLFYLRLVPFEESKLNDYTRAIEEKALLARLDGMSKLVSDLTNLMSSPSEKNENMASRDSSPKPGPSNEGRSSSRHASDDQEMQPSCSYSVEDDTATNCTPLGYHDDQDDDDDQDMEVEEEQEENARKPDIIREIQQRKQKLIKKEAKLKQRLERLPPPAVPLADGLRINPTESADATLSRVQNFTPALSVGILRVNPYRPVDLTRPPVVIRMPCSRPPTAVTAQSSRRSESRPRYDFDALAERAFNQLYRVDNDSTSDSSSSDHNSSDRNSSDNSSSDTSTSSGSSGHSTSDPVEEGLSSISSDSDNTVSSIDSNLHEEAQELLNSFTPRNGPRLIAPGVAAPRPTDSPVHEFIRPADLWGPPVVANDNPPQDSAGAQAASEDEESTDSNLSEMQPSSPKRRRPME
ncbi:hypothetical protein SFRURICE_013980 [Spodoptera frugiperda]|nr:hypothetical protein SFRURICE_013980 [Spodoptera frugiperda]